MSKLPAIQHGSTLPDRVVKLQNLSNAILGVLTSTPIIFIDGQGQENNLTYGHLIQAAKCIATGLQEQGLQPRQKVLLQLSLSEDILPVFWGCLFAGLEPIVVPIPVSYDLDSRALEQLIHIWKLLDRPLICTTSALAPALNSSSRYPELLGAQIARVENLRQQAPINTVYQATLNDVAFYVLSSGSTGLSKAVELTHGNLLSRGIGTNLLCASQESDVILSWLPFDHIGNISAYHISPVLAGSKLVYAQKEFVLARPLRWLDLIDQHRVTHGWAPNFAFALVSKALKGQADGKWDLSCVKGLLSAGELIAYSTVTEFLDAIRPYGFRRESLISAFGMAETCSGVSYHLPLAGQSIKFMHIDRHQLSGAIKHVAPDDPTCISFASLGPVIPGMSMRIVDEHNHVVDEETAGRFQLRGAGLMPGYFRNPQANQAFVDDGWFDTGDAAFISNGELVMLGRVGMGIIVNGANLSNIEIEAAAEQVEDLEPSYTAACAAFAPGTDRLHLVLFFHTKVTDERALANVFKQIQAKLTQQVGIKADFLIPLAAEAIPKTAIGKIQHKQLSTRFQQDEFAQVIERVEALRTLYHEAPLASALPASEIEQQIATIWQDVLGITQVGLQDNFFELGGDSLSLVQAHERLMEIFGPAVTLVDLFTSPTIETLVKQLSGEKTQASPTEKGQARAHSRSVHHTAGASQDIAVIGMSCRFPGADDIDTFWKNLAAGVESITFFDDQDLIKSGFSRDVFDRPDYVKASPLISDARGFDAEFFGYSARDAELMDPQQRLFLECAWEAFEVAGYDPTTYPGVTGVYAGAAMNTYLLNNVLPNRALLDSQDDLNVATLDSMGGFMLMVANDKDYLTTRVSYKLNLGGPSINVQTACSTGLVTVHMACQSLLAGETDLFLTGGASVQSPEHAGHLYQPGMIVTPDGHVRSFDAEARGTIFGSGVGAILLKRLDDAVRDGDHIFAVVKGSAVNNDAGAKVGYMAPSSDGQAIAVAEAIAVANVLPETIGFIEAHGTGTEIGDPIEHDGLAQVFRTQTQATGFCALGSVKTNVGHLQITSGTAGFIKTALALHHKLIPPLLNFKTPNPALKLEQSPFYINTEACAWKTTGTPRRAGVNSLGIGGTNAHAILEEAPFIVRATNPNERPAQVLMLTARNEVALRQYAGRFARYFTEHPDVNLADLCFTANTGRKVFDQRVSIVGENSQDFIAQLTAIEKNESGTDAFHHNAKAGAKTKIGFLFTGQGSQYPDMGRYLYETETAFRDQLNICAELFAPLLEKPLLEVMFDNGSANGLIHQTGYAQPALFALEYSLAKFWQALGVMPNAVMGHSLGEYAAACFAGVMSLADAVRLVASRASLMQSLEQSGEMWAVFASASTVRPLLAEAGKDVSIAAENSPENTVLSGCSAPLADIIVKLTALGIRTQKLNTSHAFHSRLMEPMLDRFEQIAQSIEFQNPQIALISNLTGTAASDEVTMPQYWRQHIRQSVKFQTGLEHMAALGCQVFVEIGPRPTLTGLGTQCLPETCTWLPSLKATENNWITILKSMAQLAVLGLADLKNVDRDKQRLRLPLPTYPFQHTRYWLERPAAQATSPQKASQTLLGHQLQIPTLSNTIFQNDFNPVALPFLNDHLIHGEVVVSGACHVTMLLDAAQILLKEQPFSLHNIHFPEPLVIEKDQTRTVQVVIDKNVQGRREAQLVSFDSTIATDSILTSQHAQADIVETTITTSETLALAQLRSGLTQTVNLEKFLLELASRKIELGASYRWVKSIQRNAREALGVIAEPPSRSGLALQQRHPGMLDAGFTLLLAMGMHQEGTTWLPFAIEAVRILRQSNEVPAYAYLALRDGSNNEHATADVKLCDATGNVLIELVGLQARLADLTALNRSAQRKVSALMHEITWEPVEQTATLSVESSLEAPWLILTDRLGVGHLLAQRLERAGQSCIVAQASEARALHTNPSTRTIDPLSATAFSDLIQSLGPNPKLAGIVNLWPMNSSAEGLSDIAQVQSASGTTVLHLIQACVKHNVTIGKRFCLVTERTQALTGDTLPVNIAQSTLWGIGMTAVLEHPELKVTCVDLPSANPELAAKHLWHSIHLNQNEWRLAYRDEQAFVARINRIREVTTSEQQPLLFSEQVTYVVTGATGGLGLATAAWLVEHGARRLMLLSRQPLSIQAQQAINALSQQGASVSHLCVDIADRESLESALRLTQADGPRKLGILHCAGILDDHLLIDLRWSNFDNAYSAKVHGTLNLDELTRHLEIDCFVMFSSAASLLGNRGQANYAAANSFMDAVAHQRKLAGLPALSMNWGPWASVGMAESNSKISKQLAAQGFSTLSTQLALQALGRCMLGTRTQVGVIDCQWDQYIQGTEQLQSFLSKVVSAPISTQEQRPDAQPAVIEQLAQAATAERLSLLTSIVNSQIRKILGLAETMAVPEDQALTDQGFDSLMAVQLTNAVGRQLGQRLPVSLVFNYPSPKALSLYLLEMVNTQFAESQDEPKLDKDTKLSGASSSERARSLLDDLDNLLEQS
ncbi:MAG: type I polyketide synthase [Alcaligenaceae bacterium]